MVHTITPKVSVVMSVCDGERYLHDSVESICNQTLDDFELIVVDDGSTDGTWQILSEYAARDSRVSLIRNEQNVGLTKSLNKALALVRGQYVARHDADDLAFPSRLEQQVRFLDEHVEVGLIGASSYVVDEHGRVVDIYRVPSTDVEIRWRMLFSNPFIHCTIMFRSSLVEQVGSYDEKIRFAQDYDYWVRIAEVCQLFNIARPLASWRLNTRSISQTRGRSQQASALRTSVDQVSKCIRRIGLVNAQTWGPDRIQALCKLGRGQFDSLDPETTVSTVEDYLWFTNEYLEHDVRQDDTWRKGSGSILPNAENVALSAVGYFALSGYREVGVNILMLLRNKNSRLFLSPVAWRTLTKIMAKRGWPRWILQIARSFRGVLLSARYRISVD